MRLSAPSPAVEAPVHVAASARAGVEVSALGFGGCCESLGTKVSGSCKKTMDPTPGTPFNSTACAILLLHLVVVASS